MATGKFHSILTNADLPQPNTGTPGDVWFVNQTGLLWFVEGTGNVIQLLTAVPIPTIGAQGPKGDTGDVGPSFTSQIQWSGSWAPSPVSYPAGAVVSFDNFLYLALSARNISDNTMPPAGNIYWLLLAPATTVAGKQSAVVFVVDGAGDVPTAGRKAFFQIPFNCILVSYSILADVANSSAQYDVKYSSYANMPSTTSICGSNPPVLSNAQKNEMDISTLWSPTILNATDILECDLIFAQTASTLTLQLFIVAL